MLGAFRASASGMVAQQQLIDVVSNNLANLNTTGYKTQRTLFKDTLLDVAYVGNRADHLPMLGDYNQARPITQDELNQGLTTLGTLWARRPDLGFNNITATQPFGFSNYHSLQVTLDKRLSSNFSVLAFYTFSKAIDDEFGKQPVHHQQSKSLRRSLQPWRLRLRCDS